MAYADEFWIEAKVFELVVELRRKQIDPADHSFDSAIVAGKFEQPLRFFECLAGLHGNRSLDTDFPSFLLPVRRKPIPLEWRVLWYPGILLLVVFPEMLVGVDDHAFTKGT